MIFSRTASILMKKFNRSYKIFIRPLTLRHSLTRIACNMISEE